MQLDAKRLARLRLIQDGNPSLQDLADVAKLSRPGAQSAVRVLLAAGLVSKTPGKHRNLKITDAGKEALTAQQG